jgi:hypothetical protein
VQGPCCHDALSAKLIEDAGFPFAFMSGFCTSAAAAALPDAGLLSYGEMVAVGRCIHEATRALPIIGDGDTGYGNAANVKRTVRGYAAAGFAGTPSFLSSCACTALCDDAFASRIGGGFIGPHLLGCVTQQTERFVDQPLVHARVWLKEQSCKDCSKRTPVGHMCWLLDAGSSLAVVGVLRSELWGMEQLVLSSICEASSACGLWRGGQRERWQEDTCAGILLEDQVWPKSCGHVESKQVVPRAEAVARVRAAVDARDSGADILIVARTDARQVPPRPSSLAKST